jgi:hypothetical protein
MGEKNRTGTTGPDQRFFFTKMWIVAGHPGKFSCFTDSRFSGNPINVAFSRAKGAGLQEAVGFRYFFL